MYQTFESLLERVYYFRGCRDHLLNLRKRVKEDKAVLQQVSMLVDLPFFYRKTIIFLDWLCFVLDLNSMYPFMETG